MDEQGIIELVLGEDGSWMVGNRSQHHNFFSLLAAVNFFVVFLFPLFFSTSKTPLVANFYYAGYPNIETIFLSESILTRNGTLNNITPYEMTEATKKIKLYYII